MATNPQYLSKGFYQYAQVGVPVSVRNYIFIRRDGKKCLLIRFANELEYVINAMDLTVVQMDTSGKILEYSDLHFTQMEFLPGSIYVPKSGLAVHEACTKFKVIFKTARSDSYEYYMQNGQVEVRYLRKQGELAVGESKGEYISHPYVKRRRFGRVNFVSTLVTVLAVGLMVLQCLYCAHESYWSRMVDRAVDICKEYWEMYVDTPEAEDPGQ